MSHEINCSYNNCQKIFLALDNFLASRENSIVMAN